MKTDITTLSKVELGKRLGFKCKHSHNGISHPECYKRKEGAPKERIGYADIETSSLVANFGIAYTYCILAEDGELIKHSVTLKDLHEGLFDYNLLKQFCEDARKFDRLIFHYGENGRFDIPFLRTRCEYWKLPFPGFKELYVSDTYPILKNRFRFTSNRLKTACGFFGIEAKKHGCLLTWMEMMTGNPKRMQKALDYIMVHNIEDVESLRDLWHRVSRYTRLGNTSI